MQFLLSGSTRANSCRGILNLEKKMSALKTEKNIISGNYSYYCMQMKKENQIFCFCLTNMEYLTKEYMRNDQIINKMKADWQHGGSVM